LSPTQRTKCRAVSVSRFSDQQRAVCYRWLLQTPRIS